MRRRLSETELVGPTVLWRWGSGCGGPESVLRKSLTLCWSWKFTLELRETFLEPQRELNSNWDPTKNTSGGLHSGHMERC